MYATNYHKNTHGKIILERQTTTESEKVRRVWKQVFKTFAYCQLDHVTVTSIKMERRTFQLTNSQRAAFDLPTQAAVGRKVYSTRSLVIEQKYTETYRFISAVQVACSVLYGRKQ